jgi:hypothetical protein
MSEKQTHIPRPRGETYGSGETYVTRQEAADTLNIVEVGGRRLVFVGESERGVVVVYDGERRGEMTQSRHYAFRTEDDGVVTYRLTSIVPSTPDLPRAEWRLRRLTVRDGVLEEAEMPLSSIKEGKMVDEFAGTTVDGEIRSFTANPRAQKVEPTSKEQASNVMIDGYEYTTTYDHAGLTGVHDDVKQFLGNSTEDEKARAYLADSVLSELAEAIAQSRAAKEGREVKNDDKYDALIDILSGVV